MARLTFKPTKADRETAEVGAFLGVAEAEVAERIGIARNTLRQHFSSELEHGRTRKLFEVANLLFDAARAGNVAAMKFLHQLATGRDARKQDAEPADTTDYTGLADRLRTKNATYEN
jgi:hypothetical protein